MKRVLLAAAAMSLITFCGCVDRAKTAPAKDPQDSVKGGEAKTVAPSPTLPVLPATSVSKAAEADEEEFQAEGAVVWHLSPEDAVLRLAHGKSELVVTAHQGRASTRVPVGFYTVEVTAPGFIGMRRRMALGGTATNHVVSLEPVPPPPPEPDAEAVAKADPAPVSVPYFPKRNKLRNLTLSAQEESVSSSPAGTSEPVSAPAAEAALEPVAEPSAVTSAPEGDAVLAAVETAPAPAPEAALEPVAEPSAVTSAPEGDAVLAAVETVPAPAPEAAPEPVAEPSAVTSAPEDDAVLVAVDAVPAPAPEAAPETVSEPSAAISEPLVDAVTAPVVATASVPKTLPDPAPAPQTQFVRILLKSTVPGDDGLATTPKTLLVGGDVRSIPGETLTLPYAEVAGQPLIVHAKNYDVSMPSLEGESVPLPRAVAPGDRDGTATLVYWASPHRSAIRFHGMDAKTEIWDLSTGARRADYDPETQMLTDWPPYASGKVQARRRGRQPQILDIGSLAPNSVADCDVDLRSLPVYGMQGDRCRIDLGGGCNLLLVWVPGGVVSKTKATENTIAQALTIPRGFWLSERPVSQREWMALVGFPESVPDSPMEIARPRFVEFSEALHTAEPRMTARLPRRAELLRAAQCGVAGISPDAELTLPSHTDVVAGRPAGIFHVVLSMELPRPEK